MSYGDHGRGARNSYASRHYGVKALRESYDRRIAAETDPAKKAELENARDAEIRDFETNPVRQAEAKAKANREMDKALEEMDAKIVTCRLSPEEMTARIRKVDPFYHFDCSPENLARQQKLQHEAQLALHEQELQLYRDDPYSRMGYDVWGEDRSNADYGPFVGMFMSTTDRNELRALSEMANAGKKNDPEFLKRRSELHRRINLQAIALSDQKREEYANLTTDEMISRYHEICTFCRLGDTTNCSATGLTPEEQKEYHEKMNSFLTTLGVVTNKVSVLGSSVGDRVDVDQLMNMSDEQLKAIDDNGSYLNQPKPGALALNPIMDVSFAGGQRWTQMQDYLATRHEQFAIPYGDTQKKLYADGFKRNLIYQSADGKLLEESEAREEIMRNHRPVFVSTANQPDIAPVPVFIDNGVPYSGADAIEAFKNADLHREEQAPKFEPKTQLSGWQRFKMGFANFLESIPLLNINGDVFRDEDIEAYEAEKAEFDAAMRSFEERQSVRAMQDAAETLNSPEYAEKMQRQLFSQRPDLRTKAAEIRAEKNEARAKAEKENAIAEKKALEEFKKEINGQDADVNQFRQQLAKTGLPVKTIRNLAVLHEVLREEHKSLVEEVTVTSRMSKGNEVADWVKQGIAANAITCHLSEKLLNDEVHALLRDKPKNPKLSPQLTELACLDEEEDVKGAIQEKLGEKVDDLRYSEAMKHTQMSMDRVWSMVKGQGPEKRQSMDTVMKRIGAQQAKLDAWNGKTVQNSQAQNSQAQNTQTKQKSAGMHK